MIGFKLATKELRKLALALTEIAASMRARMPWPVGRLILEEHDVPRGRGWDNTVEKLGREDDAPEGAEEALTEALRQHLLCGEKLTTFYRIAEAQRTNLIDRFLAEPIEDTAASRTFPLLLTDEQLEDEPRAMKLIAVESLEGGLHAIFSSIRVNTIRVNIEDDELSEEVRDELSEYQQLIGVKHIKTQAIDSIYIPRAQHHIDLRVDFPFGAVTEHLEYASRMLASKVTAVAERNVLGTPVNLFPLINYMYHSPQEGKVVELAFGTTTRSLKHEKMRRGAIDLRQEVYHRGGRAALQTAIEPHRISIEYTRNIGGALVSQPEVTLAGTYRMAVGTNPTLTSAIIRKCAGSEDYDYARRRIRHFLRQNASDR